MNMKIMITAILAMVLMVSSVSALSIAMPVECEGQDVLQIEDGATKVYILGNKEYEITNVYTARESGAYETKLLVNGKLSDALAAGEKLALADDSDLIVVYISSPEFDSIDSVAVCAYDRINPIETNDDWIDPWDIDDDDVERYDDSQGKRWGFASAPVTMDVFMDMEDRYFKSFWDNTLPEIYHEYISEGKLQIKYHHFPLAHNSGAREKAMISECELSLIDQGFLAYLEQVMRNSLLVEDFTLEQSMERCVGWDEHDLEEEVDQDIELGEKLGVTGVPTFFINGEKLVGAQSFAAFEILIEEALDNIGNDDDKKDDDYNKEKPLAIVGSNAPSSDILLAVDVMAIVQQYIDLPSNVGLAALDTDVDIFDGGIYILVGTPETNPAIEELIEEFDYRLDDSNYRIVGTKWMIVQEKDSRLEDAIEDFLHVIKEDDEPEEEKWRCEDSDGGFDVYKEGKAYQVNKQEYTHDFCNTRETLREVFCGDDGVVRWKNFECPNGCFSGACEEKEEEIQPRQCDVVDRLNIGETKDYRVNRKHFEVSNVLISKHREGYGTKLVINRDTTNALFVGDTVRLGNGASLSITQMNDAWVKFCLAGPHIVDIDRIDEPQIIIPEDDEPETELETPTCQGCEDENICYPIGTRVKQEGVSMYCELDGSLNPQKADGAACENNFECTSNTCSSGQCINLQKELEETRSLLERFFNWLDNIF